MSINYNEPQINSLIIDIKMEMENLTKYNQINQNIFYFDQNTHQKQKKFNRKKEQLGIYYQQSFKIKRKTFLSFEWSYFLSSITSNHNKVFNNINKFTHIDSAYVSIYQNILTLYLSFLILQQNSFILLFKKLQIYRIVINLPVFSIQCKTKEQAINDCIIDNTQLIKFIKIFLNLLFSIFRYLPFLKFSRKQLAKIFPLIQNRRACYLCWIIQGIIFKAKKVKVGECLNQLVEICLIYYFQCNNVDITKLKVKSTLNVFFQLCTISKQRKKQNENIYFEFDSF
ncbi:hypothetical protein ABPG72_004505 [Tetrahymena utriculariae]